jgi:hypothetical protein
LARGEGKRKRGKEEDRGKREERRGKKREEGRGKEKLTFVAKGKQMQLVECFAFLAGALFGAYASLAVIEIFVVHQIFAKLFRAGSL